MTYTPVFSLQAQKIVRGLSLALALDKITHAYSRIGGKKW
jgi:hypothetical protein